MQQKQKIASDEEIIIDILKGKDHRYGEILDRYETKLRRYVRRLCSLEDETIDDILQLVFIKAYRNLEGFNPSLRFSSWIYRIAHNMTIDHVRKNKHPLVSLDFTWEDGRALIDVLEDGSKISEDFGTSETLEALETLYCELPSKYREVIVLHYLEGKSYDEISDILRKPPGTIATWINRAKKQIQTHAMESKFTHLF